MDNFRERFTVTRARLIDDYREKHPFDRTVEDQRVVTRADVDRLTRVRWVTRVGSGSYTFDWGAASRALDRELSPFEQRILRESVIDEPDEVQELVDGLDAFLAE